MTNNVEKTLYHVDWLLERATGPMTKLNRQMDKEELEKFIGRYTMNMGPPLDLTNGKEDVFVFEFVRKEKAGDTVGTLKFWRAMAATSSNRHNATPPPPKEPVKQPEQIQALIDSGAVSQVNKWGY